MRVLTAAAAAVLAAHVAPPLPLVAGVLAAVTVAQCLYIIRRVRRPIAAR